MNRIEAIFDCVLVGSRPNVPCLIPVPLQMSVDGCDHHEMPYIELPPVVEEWAVDVSLDDKGFGVAIFIPLLFFDDFFYLI